MGFGQVMLFILLPPLSLYLPYLSGSRSIALSPILGYTIAALRDVPFAMVYFLSYELTKHAQKVYLAVRLRASPCIFFLISCVAT